MSVATPRKKQLSKPTSIKRPNQKQTADKMRRGMQLSNIITADVPRMVSIWVFSIYVNVSDTAEMNIGLLWVCIHVA